LSASPISTPHWRRNCTSASVHSLTKVTFSQQNRPNGSPPTLMPTSSSEWMFSGSKYSDLKQAVAGCVCACEATIMSSRRMASK